MAVTIVDIARATGKSNQTVSRALQNNPRISLKTRQLIQETAQRMGYTPNWSASHLRLGRSRIIAIGIPSPDSYSNAELAAALHSEVLAHGYSAIFSFWSCQQEQRAAVTKLLAWNPEGIITVEPQYIPDNCPVPVVSSTNIDARFDCVTFDFEQETRDLLQVLAARGHRHIGWLGRDIHSRYLQKVGASYHFKVTTLDPSDLKIDAPFCDNGGKLFDLLWKKCQGQDLPSVIIAQNDMEALGIIARLSAYNLRCPQDISVIGQSNLQIAPFLQPPLTTFDRGDKAFIAHQLIDTLLERLSNPQLPPRRIILPTRLLVRESLGIGPKSETKGEL